jgi:hypothetical protein
MSERARVTRSLSRQPQPIQQARQGATRTTRSASRDAAFIPPRSANGRTRTRNIRTDSSQSSREGKDEENIQDLGQGAVTLGAVVEETHKVDPSEPIEHSNYNGETSQISIGRMSDISGTTAYSSLTIMDAASLDAEFLIECLEELYKTSHQFLHRFVMDLSSPRKVEEVTAALRTQDHKLLKRFNFFEKSLNAVLENYVIAPNEFINHRTVLQALFHSAAENGIPQEARPDLVLFKANLSVLMKKLLLPHDSEWAWKMVTGLHHIYPHFFLLCTRISSVEDNVGASRLLDETFQFEIEIRTQMAILSVQKELTRSNQQGSQPELERILDDIFSLNNEDDAGSYRGWDVQGLGSEDSILNELQRQLKERKSTLLRYICNFTADSLAKMITDFSWMQFIQSAVSWARGRNQEIEHSLEKLGGITRLAEKLKEHYGKMSSFTAKITLAKKTRPSKSPRKSSGRKSYVITAYLCNCSYLTLCSIDPNTVRALKLMGNLQTSQFSQGETQQSNTLTNGQFPGIEVEGIVNNFDDSQSSQQVTLQAPAPGSNAYYLQIAKNLEQQNKENRNINNIPDQVNDAVISVTGQKRTFIDRQEGATRVAFGDGFDGDSPDPDPSSTDKVEFRINHQIEEVHVLPEDMTRSPGKRRIEGDQDDHAAFTQDTAFQIDSRAIDTDHARTQAPVRKKGRFKSRIDVISYAEPEWQPAEGHSSDEEEPEPEIIKRLAKMHTAAMDANRSRIGRKFWSNTEEKKLLELLGRYGCNWKVIADYVENGHKYFVGRTNVDIKDKARNLKTRYLK